MSIYKKLREAVNEVRKATDNPKDRRDLKRMAKLHGQQETPPNEPTEAQLAAMEAEYEKNKNENNKK